VRHAGDQKLIPDDMASPAQLITCPQCKAVLGADLCGLPELAPCPSCRQPLQYQVFPALFREATAVQPELVMAEGEASCFYHPAKKAAVVCAGCGRFLCSLCDVDFDGQHFCPNCLASGKEKGRIKKLQNQFTRHDRLALMLALGPMLIFYFTLITAPIALIYAARHWNSPVSVVPRRAKLRLTLAILVASLQILGWTAFFIYLATK
jgi:hypothetical protein